MPRHSRALTGLDLLRRAVDHAAERGESLAQIEAEVISSALLDEERRAALWLYAWHRLDAPLSPHAAPRLAPV